MPNFGGWGLGRPGDIMAEASFASDAAFEQYPEIIAQVRTATRRVETA